MLLNKESRLNLHPLKEGTKLQAKRDYLEYDIKHLGVMYSGVCGAIPSLPLLPVPLSPRVVVSITVPFMVQINILENYYYQIVRWFQLFLCANKLLLSRIVTRRNISSKAVVISVLLNFSGTRKKLALLESTYKSVIVSLSLIFLPD